MNNVDKVPFLVGGTGQYIWGLIDGFRSQNVAPNNVLRYQLQQKAQDQGSIALWNQLELVDPLSASKIDYMLIYIPFFTVHDVFLYSLCVLANLILEIVWILEAEPNFPVVQPIGKNAFDFYYQPHFEKWCKHLNNKF